MLEELQGCAEPLTNRLEMIEVRELIARPLQKQHWDLNVCHMLSSVGGWPTCRVKREAQEGQASYTKGRRV